MKKKKQNSLSARQYDMLLQDIVNGENDKKKLANKYAVNIGFIFKYFDEHKKEINEGRERIRIDKLNSDLNNKTIEEIKQEMDIDTESTQQPNTVNSVEEVSEDNTKRKHKNLDKALVDQIYSDLQEDALSKQEIADMYGISYSTVCRIAKGQHPTQLKVIVEDSDKINNDNIDHTKEDIINLDQGILVIPAGKEEQIEYDHDTNDLPESILKNRYPVTEYVKVGMISDRHNLPTNTCIFETMDDKLMFDYEKQYDLATEKIKSLIKFDENNNALNGLAVYVTGLACALTTIIKVCEDLHINLTLLHFNNETRSYEAQIVHDKFMDAKNIKPECMDNVNCRGLYTYKCSIDDFINNSGGYEISDCFFEDNNSKSLTVDSFGNIDRNTVSYRNLILCKDKDAAWQYYISLVDSVTGGKNNRNIYFNTIEIKHNKYIKTGTISKSINVFS